MSVEDVINYKPSEEEDYYALLSCDESATVEQITAEYKVLALQYHPDKNEGDKEAERKFQQLKVRSLLFLYSRMVERAT
ncbi:hypothetical protein E2986_13956 [Frieseomelitta varia]|uniref:J domain-containing protein n=1 Tax=Frieseomelitta varia TaxID=561572 RepID=A0A833RX74_9HYME|nr:J domain-containing protein-like [Frieseomelitta varia]KAF3419782.1 hypothetical protein E2986_13956 [Frieseomelitta varia]